MAVPPDLADPEPRTSGGSPKSSLAAAIDIRETAAVSAVPLNEHHPVEPSTLDIASTTWKAVMGSDSGPPRTLGT